MKKLLLLIALSLISLIAISQKNNTKLSNYEKYLLLKEKVDTVYNNDTVFVDSKVEDPEYDDLYYIAKRDTLRIQSKELRLKKKQLRFEQNEAYFDAVEQVQDTYSNLYFYCDYRIRLYFGFRPYYHYYSYWDPFYAIYEPWLAYSWGSPYFYEYYPFYQNYWYGYNNRYYDWGWNWNWYFPRYRVNNNYNYYSSNVIGSQLMRLNKSNDVSYGRRERQSNFSSEWNKRQPVTINRTVQVNRGTGRVIGQSVRTINDKTQNRSPIHPTERKTYISPTSKDINPREMPEYNQSRRTYTPNYNQPHMNVRPQYNNTNVHRSSNEQRYNYDRSTPMTQSRTSTPSRSTYSGPTRNSSSNYSAPSRNSSSYGGSSSYNGNSSGSRSSSSGGSSVHGSSSNGSSSGGSTSSGRR